MSADSVVRAINRTASKSLGIDAKQFIGREMSFLASEHAHLAPFVDAVTRHRNQGDISWEEEICPARRQWPSGADVSGYGAGWQGQARRWTGDCI